MLYAFLHTLIALCLMVFIYWNTNDEFHSDFPSGDEEKSKAVMICSATLWPLTILLLGLMFLWEKYRQRQRDKVWALFQKYGIDKQTYREDYGDECQLINNCIRQFDIKELQLMVFVQKVQAWELEESSKNLVERLLAEKAFEKEVLEK